MRALVVTNLYPTPEAPARGLFVRDQVEALRRLGAEVELFTFPPGTRNYVRAAVRAARRFRGAGFDVVHAHFGLCAFPALAVRGAPHVVTLHGTDLEHPASGPATRLLVRMGVVPAPASRALARRIPGAGVSRAVPVLPCGVNLERFRPAPRGEARERLGLDAAGRYLLFPADPARRSKRADLAHAVARRLDAELLTYAGRDPADVPLLVNAASAMVMPSEREGFGLAVLEALACDVPVVATDVGIHPVALRGVEGTLCGPFDIERWTEAAARHLDDADPRVDGRPRARAFSAERMAERVLRAWEELAR